MYLKEKHEQLFRNPEIQGVLLINKYSIFKEPKIFF